MNFAKAKRISVAMLSYNHEKHIAQSVSSVLNQKLDCEWNVIIGDDASTDGSLAVLQSVLNSAPVPVEVLTQTKNLGFFQNMESVLAHCDSDFVAFLECDDYWLSPTKLQWQVDLLNCNPELAMSCHCAVLVSGQGTEGGLVPRNPLVHDSRFTLEDVMKDNFIVTGSVVVRRSLLSRLPDWARGLKMLDRPMWIAALQHGLGHFSTVCHSAYRWHSTGVWGGMPREDRILAELEFFRAVESACPQLSGSVAAGRRALVSRLVRQMDDLSIRVQAAENPPFGHLIKTTLSRLGRGIGRRLRK